MKKRGQTSLVIGCVLAIVLVVAVFSQAVSAGWFSDFITGRYSFSLTYFKATGTCYNGGVKEYSGECLNRGKIISYFRNQCKYDCISSNGFFGKRQKCGFNPSSLELKEECIGGEIPLTVAGDCVEATPRESEAGAFVKNGNSWEHKKNTCQNSNKLKSADCENGQLVYHETDCSGEYPKCKEYDSGKIPEKTPVQKMSDGKNYPKEFRADCLGNQQNLVENTPVQNGTNCADLYEGSQAKKITVNGDIKVFYSNCEGNQEVYSDGNRVILGDYFISYTCSTDKRMVIQHKEDCKKEGKVCLLVNYNRQEYQYGCRLLPATTMPENPTTIPSTAT